MTENSETESTHKATGSLLTCDGHHYHLSRENASQKRKTVSGSTSEGVVEEPRGGQESCDVNVTHHRGGSSGCGKCVCVGGGGRPEEHPKGTHRNR